MKAIRISESTVKHRTIYRVPADDVIRALDAENELRLYERNGEVVGVEFAEGSADRWPTIDDFTKEVYETFREAVEEHGGMTFVKWTVGLSVYWVNICLQGTGHPKTLELGV
jgi:hypothetical protein